MFKKLLLCAALCAVNSTVYADNIALLIGVGKYKNINALEGPTEDVAALKKVLIDKWGFTTSNIQTLVDSQATQKNILNALQNLEKRSKSGDNVFVYFSGHGTSAKNTDNNTVTRLLPHTSGAFLPVDFTPPKEGRKLNEQELKSSLIVGRWHLQPILKRLEQDRSVFVVMDSCFSGNGVRSLGKAVIKRQYDVLTSVADDTVVEDTNRAEVVELPYPYQNVVFISASSDAEIAADMGSSDAYLTVDGKPHGAFTNALLQVLEGSEASDTNGDKQISFLEIRDTTERLIRKFKNDEGKQRYVQTPQILPSAKDSNANIVYRSLFGSKQVALTSAPKLETMVYVQLQNGLNASELGQINGVSTASSSTADFIVAKSGRYYSLQTGAGDSVVKNVAIEVIRERITAEVWLKQQLKLIKPTYGMRLETSKNADLTEGNTFVFNTQVQASSYILLFYIDVQGRLSVLYPTLPHELKTVAANTLLSVPSGAADESIVVKAPFGVDTVVALALPKSFSLDDVKNIQETYVLNPSIKSLEKIIKAQPTASWAQLQVRTYPKH